MSLHKLIAIAVMSAPVFCLLLLLCSLNVRYFHSNIGQNTYKIANLLRKNVDYQEEKREIKLTKAKEK